MPPARHRETQSVVAIQINQKDYTVTGLLRPIVLAKTPLHWIATSLRSSPTTTGCHATYVARKPAMPQGYSHEI